MHQHLLMSLVVVECMYKNQIEQVHANCALSFKQPHLQGRFPFPFDSPQPMVGDLLMVLDDQKVLHQDYYCAVLNQMDLLVLMGLGSWIYSCYSDINSLQKGWKVYFNECNCFKPKKRGYYELLGYNSHYQCLYHAICGYLLLAHIHFLHELEDCCRDLKVNQNHFLKDVFHCLKKDIENYIYCCDL